MGGPGSLVSLGVVTGAHGLRGELRVKLWNQDSELLQTRDSVLLRGPGELPARELLLDGLRAHGQGLLVFLRGIDDRDQALALRSAEICVPRADLPQPDEGEFYLVDLVGLQVRKADGTPVGEVEDAFAYPAAEVARVRTARGAVELPLMAPYLIEVRLEDGVLVVGDLEDLDVVEA